MALTSYSVNHVLLPQKSLACDPQDRSFWPLLFRLSPEFQIDWLSLSLTICKGIRPPPEKSTQCLPAIIAIGKDPTEITIRARARAPQTEVTDTKDIITIGTVIAITVIETTVMIAIGIHNQPLRRL
jgi:hypothetical protein